MPAEITFTVNVLGVYEHAHRGRCAVLGYPDGTIHLLFERDCSGERQAKGVCRSCRYRTTAVQVTVCEADDPDQLPCPMCRAPEFAVSHWVDPETGELVPRLEVVR